MPRKFLSRIHQYYEFIDGKSVCQIADYEGNVCNVPVKGRHAGNLEKHILRCHEEVWNDYFNNIKTPQLTHKYPLVDPSAASVAAAGGPAAKRPKSLAYASISSATLKSVNFSYRNIERACVVMATVDGRPFSFVEEVGFRMMLNPLLSLMNCPITGYPNCAINKNRLIKLIKEEAEVLRQMIVEKLANRLISLKIDCAYFLSRYYLNCTVYFAEENCTFSYTFPLIEIRDINNTEAIKAAILVVLAKYEISIHQIFAITVDNSANIISAELLKNDNLVESCFDRFVAGGNASQGNGDEGDASELRDIDMEAEYDTFVVEVDYDEESEDNVVADPEKETYYEQTEEFADKVMECWPSDEDLELINSRCVANMFHSVITDALNDPQLESLIKKVREVVKKLRTFHYASQLRALNCRKSLVLDCRNRWTSTHDMLERLLEVKSYILKISRSKELFISPAQWDQVDEFVASLKPCKIATLRLQKEEISMSEFFKIWSVCLLKTRKLETHLAKTLCANLEKKQRKLFNNIAFASCIFLDPRFKNILEMKDQVEIVEYLAKLYERIVMLNPISAVNVETITDDVQNPETDHDGSGAAASAAIGGTDGNTSDEELDQFLKTIIKDQGPNEEQSFNATNIRMLLQAFFDAEPILHMREDVYVFWYGKKYAYPELHRLAQVVLNIPANQSSVQKLASQLKYIMNSNCPASLNSTLVNDILLLRVNSEHLMDYWNAEDIQ